MHNYYDENFLVTDPAFEEFDPYLDDPHNPRKSVRMLQSAGCITLVTALVIAAGIGGCCSIVNKHKNEKLATEKQVAPAVVVPAKERKDIAPFMQRVDTYSGIIKQHGE
ncbi:MAG: hypothetical protein ILP11_01480 [Alphaproteobacteria bacterium]|nr:hypothetical protein [Alphaproteobacteria bacterium]